MEHQNSNKAAATPAGADAAQARLAGRRRFLKGSSLALPAVMTLHSVSAQAQARQSAYCANDVDQSAATPVIEGTDDYFRKSVNVYAKLVDGGATLATSDKNNTKKLETLQSELVSDGKPTYFLGSQGASDVWRYVADGAPVPAGEIPFINAGGGLNPQRANTADPGNPVGTMNAIVHFDSTSGAVVSIGAPSGENFNAMVTSLTGACLHSLWGQTV